jgi:hypothetical protein
MTSNNHNLTYSVTIGSGLKIGLLSLLFIALGHSASASATQDTSCVGENGIVKWHYYNGIEGVWLDELYAYPYFPQVPDGYLQLFSLETPYKFNEYFGSIVTGFIKAPESGMYIFNVTGDNQTRFLISDGTDPQNLLPIAETQWSTGSDQHDKYDEQTSDTFQLVEGRYYYFELHHKEQTGGDHASVYWKTPFYPDSVWTPVHGLYLYENLCFTTCDPVGTPCDDGDSTTMDDAYDGFCNCFGNPVSPNPCIGQKGELLALYYDSVTGNPLNNMYEADHYPLSPNRADVLNAISIPRNVADHFGTIIKGYLSVPVDGWYQFNLTSDDHGRLYLANEHIDSLELMAEVIGWTRHYEHYKYETQTSDSVYFDANAFYYFELHHKEGWGGDNLDLFWRTPFMQDTTWIAIPSTFFYRYNCETACVPAGTACDDGDPNTSGDQYDGSCNCVGTPCGGPCPEDQDPGAQFTAYESCGITDKHSNNVMDSWLSCDTSANPNPTRGSSHWIMYDFGEKYKFTETKVWNYNVEGLTEYGGKSVIIDYSDDGTTWYSLGPINWTQASGDNTYEGEIIDAMMDVAARYLLFTLEETWGTYDCGGFSEIVFKVDSCRDAGTPCDDGNEDTIDDMYDLDCNCAGLPIPINYCDTAYMMLDQEYLKSGLYSATDSIHAMAVQQFGSSATIVAGKSITLKAGFEVELGAAFYAAVEPCEDSDAGGANVRSAIESLELFNSSSPGDISLNISPNPATEWVELSFHLSNPSPVTIYIEDQAGTYHQKLLNQVRFRSGDHKKRIPVHRLANGIYLITVETGEEISTQRLIVWKE